MNSEKREKRVLAAIMPSISKTNGVCPKFTLMCSPGRFIPTEGKSFPLMSRNAIPNSQSACFASTQSVVSCFAIIPRCSPFLVKKADPVLKFTPHPMTSPAVNCGPYVLPELWQQKEFPSSPWYAHESGSHPGSLVSRTFLFENPMPIEVLDAS